MAVPYNAQPLASAPQPSDRSNVLGPRGGPVYGIVYDPNQIIAAQSY
jgi:hypothetical protein